jgi:hypothetical protein
MTGDDTGGNVWTVAGAWVGIAWGVSAARSILLDLYAEGVGDRRIVTGGECASRDLGDLRRPC